MTYSKPQRIILSIGLAYLLKSVGVWTMNITADDPTETSTALFSSTVVVREMTSRFVESPTLGLLLWVALIGVWTTISLRLFAAAQFAAPATPSTPATIEQLETVRG